MGLVATNKWIIKIKNMTYIVGGKIDNKAFILVDKVVNDEPSESVDKLYHSVSNGNIYISLTGDGEIMDSIKELDEGLKLKNKKLEISDNFIKDITLDFLSKYSDDISKRTSLYIVDSSNFKRIDINFNDNKFIDYQIIEFGNNEWIYCDSNEKNTFNNSGIKNIDIKGYFETNMKNLYEKVNTLPVNGISTHEYFINGFDYIEK
jgi:hypothetical protein